MNKKIEVKKEMVFICEYEFIEKDLKDPNYSYTEIDFFAEVPAKFRERDGNFRLTLRKNLITNEYELIKIFLNQAIQNFPEGIMIINQENGKDEITIHHKDLAVVLAEANGYYEKYYKKIDKVCKHKFPNRDSCCMKNKYKED